MPKKKDEKIEAESLELEGLTDAELAALERQNEVAAGKGLLSFEDFKKEMEKEDSEFALKDQPKDSGPEASAEASRTGVNPRTVATSSDPKGTQQPAGGQIALIEEAAEPVKKPKGKKPEAPSALD